MTTSSDGTNQFALAQDLDFPISTNELIWVCLCSSCMRSNQFGGLWLCMTLRLISF